VLDLLVGAGEEQDVKEAILAYGILRRTDRPASELLISLHARMGEARDVISRKRASVKLGETEAA